MLTNLINTSSKGQFSWLRHHQLWLAAGLLVTLPVFFQAPLVRVAPWISLIGTVGWLSLSKNYRNEWGSLLWGFALTWLCGSVYWGWWRHDPLWHLPIESLALPWALWGLSQGAYRIGSCFYLGSLVGTAATDLYFWLTDLIPLWRGIVAQETPPQGIVPLLQIALGQIQTPWGLGVAVFLGLGLLWIGAKAMSVPASDRWAFAGAVTFTLLTDALFGIGVCLLPISD